MKKIVGGFLPFFAGAAVGVFGIGRILGKTIEKSKRMSDKHLSLFKVMCQFMKTKQEGKDIASYLYEKGYQNIAIYGMSYIGKILANELTNSTVKVKYGIDQNVDIDCEGIQIVSPDEKLEKVDAIIVTPITFFAEIEENLYKKIHCPIISLEDILYEM